MTPKQVLEKLAPFKRNCYVPVTRAGASDLTASKFCGIPWLAKDEAWPICPNCQNPMQLFLQLNLAHCPELPDYCPKTGLLQLFYCTNKTNKSSCEADCEAWYPFAKSTLIRIITPEGEPQQFKKSPVKKSFPTKEIIKWTSKVDYPQPDGVDALNKLLNNKEQEILGDLDYPINDDKLLGWPAWMHETEHPTCPNCGDPMPLLFQIAGDANLPYTLNEIWRSNLKI